MACTIPIPFWPTSVDCLDWSADNQIAITGGEQVAILTPRLREKGLNDKLWNTTLIRVNAFTSKDLPLFDPPPSNANFSVGEDLSSRQALEAKWSPPGLARHKGCALAVLTANHVLSIWVPNGRSIIAENWNRVCIVNRVIEEYYEATSATEQDGTPDPEDDQLREQIRVQQRIRSFVWSPSLMRGGQDYGHEEYYLAVSTDGGDILFLRVKSPHIGLAMKGVEWTISIVGVLHLEDNLPEPTQAQDRYVCAADYMCWSRWETDNDGTRASQFVYIYGGRLFTASIKRQSGAFTVGTSKLLLRDRTDVSGPIRFVPGDESGSIIAFGEDTVFHVGIEGVARTHHLDGRWDEVSGLTFTNQEDGSLLLHITSLLSMSNASTTVLRLPLQNDEESTQPAWQHAIGESKGTYSTDLDLGGHVLERTSGIASSPLRDYIATFTSMHPSDCIAYVINVDQISLLHITRENKPSGRNVLPVMTAAASSRDSSTEAVLFSLMRQLERNSESEGSVGIDHESSKAEVLRCGLFKNVTASTADSSTSQLLDGSPEDLYSHLKMALYANPNILDAQASRIAEFALQSSKARAEVIRPVVVQLVQEISRLQPDFVSEDRLSTRMVATFAVVSAKLDPSEHSVADKAAGTHSETCKICEQPIPFESLRWAKCSSGHQMARCALSFLPIQEPGTTKSCGICGLQFLNEKMFPDVEPDDDIEMADVPNAEGNIDAPANDTWVEVSRNPDAVPQSTPTLAQILFAACDICIYCGGKYVD